MSIASTRSSAIPTVRKGTRSHAARDRQALASVKKPRRPTSSRTGSAPSPFSADERSSSSRRSSRGRPSGESESKPALELEAHRRGGVRARAVRPVHDGDVVGELEAAQDVLEPALVRRLCVLTEQCHVRAGGSLHQQVASGAVVEAPGLDLEHARPVRAGARHRGVAGARVAHEQLVRHRLPGQRLEHAREQRAAVAYGNGHAHLRHRSPSG